MLHLSYQIYNQPFHAQRQVKELHRGSVVSQFACSWAGLSGWVMGRFTVAKATEQTPQMLVLGMALASHWVTKWGCGASSLSTGLAFQVTKREHPWWLVLRVIKVLKSVFF